MSDQHKHEARIEWRCFHCGDVFVDENCARLHFGRDEDSTPACQIKAGAEQGLLAALRAAEYEASDARRAIADECTEAARAHYAQASRHDLAVRNAEEAGYERGLSDGRSLAIAAQDGPEAIARVSILRRALAWHGDPQRMGTTREEWQQEVDDAIAWVKANPEPDRPSFSSLASLARSDSAR